MPEQALVDAVRAARCELLLDGVADVDAEPERHLLGLCELLRLGDLDRPQRCRRGAADRPAPSPPSSDVAIGSARRPSTQLPWFSPQRGSAEHLPTWRVFAQR